MLKGPKLYCSGCALTLGAFVHSWETNTLLTITITLMEYKNEIHLLAADSWCGNVALWGRKMKRKKMQNISKNVSRYSVYSSGAEVYWECECVFCNNMRCRIACQVFSSTTELYAHLAVVENRGNLVWFYNISLNFLLIANVAHKPLFAIFIQTTRLVV
jgi:hypothetical protein